MKIAVNLRLLNPGKIGGMECYVKNLLEYMLKSEQDLRYFLFVTEQNFDLFQFNSELVKNFLIDNINYKRIISETLKNEKVDVYFCPLLILEPLIIDVPSIITLPDMQHEFYPEFFPSEVLGWRRKYFSPSSKIADAILTLSEFSKKTIVDKLKVDENKVYPVCLAADDIYKDTVNPEIKESVKRKYNLPDCFGFYPANTWPHKNHKELVMALDIFRKKYGEPPVLILTGSESEGHTNLMKLIKEYNIGRYITYLGYIDKEEMPCLYSNASFLIFPSLFEGFGMPVHEAMLSDCPVLCSNATSLPEVGGDGALYFDPHNPADLAEAIKKIISDRKLRNKLIEKGRIQAQNFSWANTAERTLEIVKKISKKTSKKRAKKYPLVSVVTPSFNQGEFIENTIKSVLSQDYPNIEYIVTDGGSTDNTLEITEKYSNRIKLLSESDKGQADAVNKGFMMAKGKILGWVNSDDTYCPGAISNAVEVFLTNPDILMVYGDAQFIDREGRITGRYFTEPFDLQRLADVCFICQPTVFLKSEVIKRIGALDTNLKTCMDFDYWIRIGKTFDSKKIFYLSNEFLANSRMYDENKTLGMREKVYTEIIKTVKKHFGYVSDTWIFGYIKEIILGKKLKRYEKAHPIIKYFFHLYFMFRISMQRWGWMCCWNYFRNTLRYFYSDSNQGAVYSDGWVSKFCSLSFENKESTHKLLVKGRHTWPYKTPLKIKVIINGETLKRIHIKQKGEFKFEIDIPEKYRGEYMLIVMLKPNRTFRPIIHGINDHRRLSFILDKIELR